MTWCRILPSDGRQVPWKNGGGTTRELAVEPPGATLASGFHWRLSSAEVASSGPFSAFPGIERWLWLLEGDGFEIDFSGRNLVDLREPLDSVQFPGDAPAWATLAGGPSVDLNLMVDPTRYRVDTGILHLPASGVVEPGPGTTLLFVARGTVAVPSLGLHLGRRHLLRLDGEPRPLALAAGLGGAALVHMDLRPT